MKRQTVIVVDDNIDNLKVAEKAASLFTEFGIDVYLTDSAQRALDLIGGDKEQKVVGVVTDLMFPRGQHYSGYERYLNVLEGCAEKVLRSSPETLGAPYVGRLKEQFYLLHYIVEELPYGGDIAIQCANRRIAFVIVSSMHRHVLEGQQPLDGATLFTPFCNMGFVKATDLTENRTSRHIMWQADKLCEADWTDAFMELGAQWVDDSTWQKCLGKDGEVRQPDILPNCKREKSVVSGTITRVREQLKEQQSEYLQKAREIVEKHSVAPSIHDKATQIDFIHKVLIDMGAMKGEVDAVRAKSMMWVPGEGNIRLPPCSWKGQTFRPDIGVVVAVSHDTISRAMRCRFPDNQIRNNVYVWKFGVLEPKIVYTKTWWDGTDDLEDPKVKEVDPRGIIIEQFEWKGEESVLNEYPISI